MARRIRCLKCLKIIDCSPYDTPVLLNHIRTDHPDIELPDEEMEGLDNQDDPPTVSDPHRWDRGDTRTSDIPQPRDELEEETIRNIGRKPMYTRKYKVHSPSITRSPQKRRMYKTSIEKWRPAKGTIYCPKCGRNKRPIIRSRTEKMSYSSVGAVCILTCWPLCFLPCLFPSPTREYLHCAECNNFLGMYDKQNNCVRPNREFVEDCSSRSPGRLSRASDRPSGEPCTSIPLADLQVQPGEDVPASEERKEDSVEMTAIRSHEPHGKATEQSGEIAADSFALEKGRSVGVQFAGDPRKTP